MTLKKVLFYASLVAVLASAYYFMTAFTFMRFLEYSFITTLAIFGIALGSFELVNNRRIKSKKGNVRNILLVVIMLGVFVVMVGSYIIDAGSFLCFQAVVEPHERTNILTGQCSFGGGGSNSCAKDPWFYKEGCN